MIQTVLLAGATGMLGGRIAHHLLEQPDARVRLLVRDMTSKKHALDAFAAKGAELIEGDLADPASLDRATQGVDVIVSAVQGGPDVIIDGQVALAAAGKRNGLRRILPSDFGLDLFKATPANMPRSTGAAPPTNGSPRPASSRSTSSRAGSWSCSCPAWARSTSTREPLASSAMAAARST
jgi:uncharacterized protein YbjT (DUF2867 family)